MSQVRLAEPDEDPVRCNAPRAQRAEGYSAIYTTGWIPVQKERGRCLAIARFPVGYRGTEHIYLRQNNVETNCHFLLLADGLENTVWKTMFLKRSSAEARPRSTFMRRIAPSQEARRNSANSIGSNLESIHRWLELRHACGKWSPPLLKDALQPLAQELALRGLKTEIADQTTTIPFFVCEHAADDVEIPLQSQSGSKRLIVQSLSNQTLEVPKTGRDIFLFVCAHFAGRVADWALLSRTQLRRNAETTFLRVTPLGRRRY